MIFHENIYLDVAAEDLPYFKVQGVLLNMTFSFNSNIYIVTHCISKKVYVKRDTMDTIFKSKIKIPI